jgi:flagellar capping protein FliD
MSYKDFTNLEKLFDATIKTDLNDAGLRKKFTDNVFKLLNVKDGMLKIQNACDRIIEYAKDFPGTANLVLIDL